MMISSVPLMIAQVVVLLDLPILVALNKRISLSRKCLRCQATNRLQYRPHNTHPVDKAVWVRVEPFQQRDLHLDLPLLPLSLLTQELTFIMSIILETLALWIRGGQLNIIIQWLWLKAIKWVLQDSITHFTIRTSLHKKYSNNSSSDWVNNNGLVDTRTIQEDKYLKGRLCAPGKIIILL